jgi:hypothetical protein
MLPHFKRFQDATPGPPLYDKGMKVSSLGLFDHVVRPTAPAPDECALDVPIGGGFRCRASRSRRGPPVVG